MNIQAFNQNYCPANYISKSKKISTFNNSATSPNINNNQSCVNSEYLKASLPNISFSGNGDKLSDTQKMTTEFGVNLYEKIVAGEEIDINEEIKTFILENGIENVKIDNLSNTSYATEKTAGGYLADFDDEMNLKEGVLYLQDFPKTNDKKEIQRYVSVLAHELQHMLNADENEVKTIAQNNNISSDNMKGIVGFTTEIAKYFRNFLQQNPLQFCIHNSKEFGLNREELSSINKDISKYGAIYPKKSMKSLCDTDIARAFGRTKNFNCLVKKYFYETINTFNNSPDVAKYASLNTYKALKDYYIHALRDEASAYQINSEINKRINGIYPSRSTLNDLIPITYNLVADTLEKISLD